MAILLAGCSVFDPSYGVAFPAESDLPGLPVNLTDRSRLVTKLELAVAEENPSTNQFIRLAPASADAVLVQWVATGCDASVSITVENRALVPTGSAAATPPPKVTILVATKRMESACVAHEVRRAVIIHFSQLVDMRRTALEFGP